MKCPICEVELVMSERQGVEIDYCPKCRGIWLDRGELDKIIEKSASNEVAESSIIKQPQSMFGGDNYGHGHGDSHHGHNGYQKNHKKKGLLGELFDF